MPQQHRGLGLHGSRRRRSNRDVLQGITRHAIRRLTRRGGIKRMSASIYPEIRFVLKERLKTIIRNLVLVLESSATPNHERKTITTTDVCRLLGNDYTTPL
ncbi:histone H4, putative [Talaromyces stipitatus ATCC 10500]|uniref:Histone H4, putative n=1 Tax=Talaromyces stipitatus (strain ATCC 10500 / CBS 375.48 / QM 6759 / NRRL 1006) TaxID=441959 RepID=B8LY39_TALSN|nr:histone H4, putative [Talaromyces stipitatus ATCC 10500]EED23283.1 histone H4, putative [Talaromyces stipitatus ATCC 10500]